MNLFVLNDIVVNNNDGVLYRIIGFCEPTYDEESATWIRKAQLMTYAEDATDYMNGAECEFMEVPLSELELDSKAVRYEDGAMVTLQLPSPNVCSQYGVQPNRLDLDDVYTVEESGLDLDGVYGYRLTPGDWYLTNDFIAGICTDMEARPQRYTCERCRRTYRETQQEHQSLHAEDRTLCPNCRKRLFVAPYHRYAPHIDFFKTEEETDNDLYLGVELEIDNGGELDGTAQYIMTDLNHDERFFAWCSHDGSLNEGIEIITAPATLDYHMSRESEYKALFKKLVRDGYRSHNTTTAGIHVHFSRKFFQKEGNSEEENILKLLYLIEHFWDEIVIFSRRDYRSLEHYAKKTDRDFKQYVYDFDKSGNHDGHYYAVNITNPDTIELRMFRGTLNVEAFMCILEFVDRVARIATEKTTEELQALSFEDLLTDRAKSYFDSRVAQSKYEEI